MAFVSKQERDNTNIKNETRNIGPGEYYESNYNDDLDKEIQNCYPFNSHVDRVTFEIPHEHKIRNIGPGTYEANSSFLKKSFSTRSFEHFNSFDRNLFDLIERTKEIQQKDHHKIIQEAMLIKRLQLKKSTKVVKQPKPRQSVKIYDTTNSSLRVVSIPLKNSFGYVFDEQNNPILVEVPNQSMKQYGDNSNSQSNSNSNTNAQTHLLTQSLANNYSQDEDTKRRKLRGIEWSKMSLKHSSTITSDNNCSVVPFTQQDNSSASVNSKQLSLNKLGNYRARLNKSKPKPKPKTKASIEDQIIDEVLAKPPGPGYYWNEEYNPFIKQFLKKTKPFGSCEDRELKLTQRLKENNPKVGPGSYYLTRYIPKSVNYYPFNANDKKLKDPFSYRGNPYLGPGSYNVRKNLNESKPASMYFGSLNRRFNYYIKEENINPGPGEYIDILAWGKNDHSPVKSNKPQKSVDHKEFITPGAGEYNHDIAHSIEYKIKSNENKLQSFIAPFSSGTERFVSNSNNNSMNDALGPGCYYHDRKDLEYQKRKELPKVDSNFNSHSSNCFNNDNIGPGTYKEFNYYHWNKRSYNVNFV